MINACLRTVRLSTPRTLRLSACALACSVFLSAAAQNGESPWQRLARRPSTLGLPSGVLDCHTPAFHLRLVRSSQTVASLSPNTVPNLDYTPGDSLRVRSGDGLYHLGDLTLRLKTGDGDWKRYSSAAKR